MVAMNCGYAASLMSIETLNRTTKETYRAEGGPLPQGRTRREGTDGGKLQGGGVGGRVLGAIPRVS